MRGVHTFTWMPEELFHCLFMQKYQTICAFPNMNMWKCVPVCDNPPFVLKALPRTFPLINTSTYLKAVEKRSSAQPMSPWSLHGSILVFNLKHTPTRSGKTPPNPNHYTSNDYQQRMKFTMGVLHDHRHRFLAINHFLLDHGTCVWPLMWKHMHDDSPQRRQTDFLWTSCPI